MGDDSKEATEEEMDQASDLRGKAAAAYSEGNFEGKLRHCVGEILLKN